MGILVYVIQISASTDYFYLFEMILTSSVLNISIINR